MMPASRPPARDTLFDWETEPAADRRAAFFDASGHAPMGAYEREPESHRWTFAILLAFAGFAACLLGMMAVARFLRLGHLLG